MSKQTNIEPVQGTGKKEAGANFGRPGHEQLVKGLSHPVRTRCLTVLTDRVASPRELSEILEEDLSNVSYHVRVLDELGLIELVGEEPVRGAVAHFYKAVERPLLSNDQWEKMPLEVRKAFSAYNWDVLIKDATIAIEKGTFDSRPDRHLTRTPLLLDSEGFARLSKAMDDLLELIFEEQAASAERRKESGEEAIHAVAGTALFVMPEADSAKR
ncbi:MAG TPA: winged helix-turn-helix domain-containing protein [Solirubrobacterales bacterium]|nr:winged helix-turn-helix domain-containing protein [Solirubrobacterales bacterium]